MTRIADIIDRINARLGRLIGWTALLLIATQFLIIIMTNIFRVGSVMLQESLLYINSLMFLGAVGYTLLLDAQVRVDIIYRSASRRFQAWVNLLGTIFFLLPVTVLLWVYGLPYVLASWAVLEGSVETTGLQAVFILKSFILLFCGLLGLQGVSLAIRSAQDLFGKDQGKSG